MSPFSAVRLHLKPLFHFLLIIDLLSSKHFSRHTFLPFFSISFPLVLLFSWLLLLSSSDWRNCRSIVCCDSMQSANRLSSMLRRVLLRVVFYVLEAFSCSDNSPCNLQLSLVVLFIAFLEIRDITCAVIS